MAQFGWEIIHPVTIYLSFNHRETLSTAAQCSVLRGGEATAENTGSAIVYVDISLKTVIFSDIFLCRIEKRL